MLCAIVAPQISVFVYASVWGFQRCSFQTDWAMREPSERGTGNRTGSTLFLYHKGTYMSKRQSLFVALISLSLAGMIYILFRSTDMYMFLPVKACGGLSSLNEIRFAFAGCHLPDWFLYSLPDGLWLYAYMLIVRCLWYNDNSVIKVLFLSVLPVFAITIEVLQFLSLYFGTGDIIDIVFYLVFILLYVIF